MKINPRYYPVIIIAAFMTFLLIGFALGFRPRHNEGGHSLLLLLSCLT